MGHRLPATTRRGARGCRLSAEPARHCAAARGRFSSSSVRPSALALADHHVALAHGEAGQRLDHGHLLVGRQLNQLAVGSKGATRGGLQRVAAGALQRVPCKHRRKQASTPPPPGPASQVVAKIQLHGSVHAQAVLHAHVHGRGVGRGLQQLAQRRGAAPRVQLLPVCVTGRQRGRGWDARWHQIGSGAELLPRA